jgi:hypothetical protein
MVDHALVIFGIGAKGIRFAHRVAGLSFGPGGLYFGEVESPTGDPMVGLETIDHYILVFCHESLVWQGMEIEFERQVRICLS